MKDLNTVTLVGRLTKDADFHAFNNDNGVIQFTLAVNTTKKTENGYVDEGNFFTVKTFGKSERLMNMVKNLIKGKQVAVKGYLKQDRWEGDNGEKKSSIAVIADEIQYLGSKKDSSESQSPADNDLNLQEDCPF